MTNPKSASRRSMCDVLILEDEEYLRVLVALLLEDAGFSVCEASNSAQALAILEAVPCRVLLVDLRLGPDSPIRDGRDFAAEASHLYPSRAVIYTSGEEVDLGRPLSARERIVLKPYLPNELIGAIRELMHVEYAEAVAC